MHNFLPVDGNGKSDRSVLEDPAAQQLARHYTPMIDKYRDDVASLRVMATLGARGWQGLAVDAIDELRGLLAPGAGRNAVGVPTWPEHMQQLREERSHAPQDWQPPLRVLGHEDVIKVANGEATPTLHDDPAAFLNRMLAASQSGDRGPVSADDAGTGQCRAWPRTAGRSDRNGEPAGAASGAASDGVAAAAGAGTAAYCARWAQSLAPTRPGLGRLLKQQQLASATRSSPSGC